jgi:murein DD-endopeptidase MepM/ murein hydrolase activator NlpD
MHSGIDLGAPKGEVVTAAAAGWVVRTGPAGGYGLMVEVRHSGDLTTRYSHLSLILCSPGEAVDVGQPLGLVGQTGRATGPHLHFEVWRGGLASDPLHWLTEDRVAALHPANRSGPSGGPR